MLDIAGQSLTEEDKEILRHPQVGGLILFSRNYDNPEQLRLLINAIRDESPNILIAVDQEGGRVQRFRDGFTRIPAMGTLLPLANGSIEHAAVLAKACGVVIGFEMTQMDIDVSFAPVLDINAISEVIGDRAFATNANQVIHLAEAFILGMRSMGMSSTGKHFPGHGSVKADSHIDIPVDPRDFDTIACTDMHVFSRLNEMKLLDAVMPAHVIYPAVDQHPAGFSSIWLQNILRRQLNFNGVIFSDDLSMHAATVAGNADSRAQAALNAGCDMALVCNNRDDAITVLESLGSKVDKITRASKLKARSVPASHRNSLYQHALKQLEQIQELEA
ncbi:beta-N-acetylhexosaminidase [Alteromonas facilis]|uniref:beta-N-acetylhexosaminidase n=1 Tax=Alteromonas facilis TaxID=2048004 RepID=UPI003B83848C